LPILEAALRGPTSFVIDERGEILFSDAMMAQPNGESIEAAARRSVVEFGHIWWTARESFVRVSFRPSVTSAAAHQRLLGWLAARGASRVHLCWWLENQWWHEIVGSPQLAATSVDRLIVAHGGGAEGLLRSRMKTNTAVQRMSPFAVAVNFWREGNVRTDSAAVMLQLESIVGGSFVTWHMDEHGIFKARRVGDGLSEGLKRWFTCNIGKSLDAIPNVDLARNCDRAYKEATHAFMPRADEIDTFARWPRNDRVRVSYHRLILPFRSSHGPWLISATRLDSRIDLFQ
jgi:hypothetical protein